MRLPVYSDSTGRQPIYPGATMTRDEAQRWGDRNVPRALRRVGFRAYVFASDPEIHGDRYFRVTFGKEC